MGGTGWGVQTFIEKVGLQARQSLTRCPLHVGKPSKSNSITPMQRGMARVAGPTVREQRSWACFSLALAYPAVNNTLLTRAGRASHA